MQKNWTLVPSTILYLKSSSDEAVFPISIEAEPILFAQEEIIWSHLFSPIYISNSESDDISYTTATILLEATPHFD